MNSNSNNSYHTISTANNVLAKTTPAKTVTDETFVSLNGSLNPNMHNELTVNDAVATNPRFRRFRLDLAYAGTAFHGWAKQQGLRTVQGELETWITKVLRLQEPVDLTVAGRTDAGVHARGQVAHFDLSTTVVNSFDRDLAGYLLHKLRRALPPDLSIWQITEVSPDFDARFSAIWRKYQYRISDTTIDPLLRNQVLEVHETIDLNLLNEAASLLLGLHDFVAFCKAREGASTIRELKELSADRAESGIITVTVRADAFCHSQVRSLMGALLRVATKQRPLSWLTGLLKAQARCGEIPVLPAKGLCLVEVGYPEASQWAIRQIASRRTRNKTELLDHKSMNDESLTEAPESEYLESKSLNKESLAEESLTESLEPKSLTTESLNLKPLNLETAAMESQNSEVSTSEAVNFSASKTILGTQNNANPVSQAQ